MLDITAFSNALRNGKVSFLAPLGARPHVDRDGAVISFSGEDTVVFPLVRQGEGPELALRLPLEHDSGHRWPSRYADLEAAAGAMRAHLPRGLTILDIDDVPGTEVALLYDWVPGQTLTTHVTRARERVDRDRLSDLLWPLAEVAEALRAGGMVHGDIAPGNLVIRPDGEVVLIDLDRMGFRDAGTGIEPRRRAGYRLPRGGGSAAEEDAFALLVITVTCAILADANIPTDHDRAPASSHPILLFSSWDLMDPQRSRLVRDLEPQLSPLTRELLGLLFAACTGRPDRLPGLMREAVRLIRLHGTRPEPEAIMDVEWQPVGQSDRTLPTVHADPWGLRPPSEMSGWEATGTPERSQDAEAGSWPEPIARERSAPLSGTQSRPVTEILQELHASSTVVRFTEGPSRSQRRADTRRRHVSERLRTALADNDRAVLVDLAMSGALAELGDSDRDDVVQVVRALAHDTLGRAIASDDDGRIVAAVDEAVFAKDTDLDPAVRDRVRLARNRERWTGRVLAAVRERDGQMCSTLLGEAPAGGEERLPDTVRLHARRLAELHVASADAREAIRAQDPNGLADALGRLVVVRPAWTDHVDAAAVVALLGEEQIEHRLVSLFARNTLADENQWMIDIVIAAGRLPEVTRLAGLSPKEVDRMIYRQV